MIHRDNPPHSSCQKVPGRARGRLLPGSRPSSTINNNYLHSLNIHNPGTIKKKKKLLEKHNPIIKMKAMLTGSGNCGLCMYLEHLKAVWKSFLFPVKCATYQYKHIWLTWSSNFSRPFNNSSVASWCLENSSETNLMLSHSSRQSAAKMSSCKTCWLSSLDLALTNYWLISLSSWPWLRPWESLTSEELHPDDDILYNMKYSSLTLSNSCLDSNRNMPFPEPHLHILAQIFYYL